MSSAELNWNKLLCDIMEIRNISNFGKGENVGSMQV